VNANRHVRGPLVGRASLPRPVAGADSSAAVCA
jgi:hypothetical protein